ncbi:MAG: translocation/assembly module TamB domain-containing protein [Succinivibrionaceae bacterium]
MKILLFLLKILTILLLIFSSVFLSVMYTNWGSTFIWKIATSKLEFLHGDLVSGNLGSGFELNNFHLDLGFLDLKIDKVKTRLDLSRILSGKVILSRVDAGRVDMRLNFDDFTHNPDYDRLRLRQIADIWQGDITASTVRDEDFARDYVMRINQENLAEKAVPFYVDLPLDIRLDDFSAGSYTLDNSIFHLQIQDIRASAGLTGHLIYGARVFASQVDFELKDQKGEILSQIPFPEIKNGFDKEQVKRSITTIPTVHIPFDIQIQSVDLRQVRYHMTGYDTDLVDVFFKGIINQSRIFITEGHILSRQYGNFTLQGEVGLEDYLHLNLDLQGICRYNILEGALKGIPLKVSTRGDLTDLTVSAESSDHRKIKARGRLNVLDGILSSELDLTFRHVSWPLRAKAGSEFHISREHSSLKSYLDASYGRFTRNPPTSVPDLFPWLKQSRKADGKNATTDSYDAGRQQAFENVAVPAREANNKVQAEKIANQSFPALLAGDASPPEEMEKIHGDGENPQGEESAPGYYRDSSLSTAHQDLSRFKQDPQVELMDAAVYYQGSLNDFSLDFVSRISAFERPAVVVAGSARGSYSNFDIEDFRLFAPERPDHYFRISGNFVRDEKEISLEKVKIQSFKAPLHRIFGTGTPGELQGSAEGSFSYKTDSNEIDFQLSRTHFTGSYGGNPLLLSGFASGKVDPDRLPQSTILFRDWAVAYGSTSLKLNGSIMQAGYNHLSFDLSASELKALTSPFLASPVTGSGMIRGSLKGNLRTPEISLDINIPELEIPDLLSLRNFSLQAQEQVNLDKLTFQGDLNVKLEELISGEQEFNKWSLKLNGSQKQHRIYLSGVLGDDLKLETDGSGSLEQEKYNLQLGSLSADTPLGNWMLKNKPKFSWNFHSRRLDFSRIVMVMKSNVVNISPGFYDINGGTTGIKGKITNFQAMSFSRYLPENVLIGAVFNGSFNVEKKVKDGPLLVKMNITSKNGSFTNSVSSAEFKQIALDFDFNSQGSASGRFLLDGDRYGRMEVNADYALNPKAPDARRVNLDIRNLDLELIAPLVPKIDLLQGRLNTKGEIRQEGTDGRFFYYGNVILDSGRLVTEADVVSADNINLWMDFNRSNVVVNGSFDMGSGTGRIEGNLNIDPVYDGLPPLGEITLTGDHLGVNLAGYGNSIVDYHTTMKFAQVDGKDRLIIRGDVNIPQSRIIVKSMENSGVMLSEDVEVVETREENSRPARKIKVPPYVDYEMNVNIGNDVVLKGYGLTTSLEGKIRISNNNQNKEFALNGKINLVDGKFKSFGQNLIIRLGKIDFVGNPKNTTALVEAIRNPETITDGSGVVVGVRVIRTMSKIDMNIFSSPEMSEQEKLSYLLNGSSISDDGDTGSSSAAATGMLLNASLSGATMAISSIVEDIGINNFQLETTGSGSSSQVSASANLTDRLKVSYGYGLFDAIGEFRVRYQIFSRLFVQFVNRTDQAVDIFYNFSID